MAYKVKVIGIGDDGKQSLSNQALKWVEEADLLVGGRRHLAFFPEFSGDKVIIQGGLSSILDRIKQASDDRQVVVLASGDPLFYGIGGHIVKKLGRDRVEVHPYLSSIQLAAARMGENWQKAKIESLHGRSLHGLIQRISGQELIILLTDQHNTPQRIAQYLLDYQMSEYKAFVAENLGSKDERCTWWTLSELAQATCSPLNVLILKQKADSPKWSLGIPDHEFAQRRPDKGLITKREIRVVSLAELQIRPDSIVWDIGAGSGSVSVEATKLAPYGQVYAIEKNMHDLPNIYQNQKKFRTEFTVVHSKAPEGLDKLPDPDAIFIGGSGGNLKEILQTCCERLRPDGRIVMNAATFETMHISQTFLKEKGFRVSTTLMQTARSKPIAQLTRLEGLNPVFIIVGERE
jgi:precorrin-6Y C5,15-methyltransferase (decarboxylating)